MDDVDGPDVDGPLGLEGLIGHGELQELMGHVGGVW